ncbi:hypothetical protein JCM8208_005614 [Rhodotorula glutinis]
MIPSPLILSILGAAIFAALPSVDATHNGRRAIARADDGYSGARRHLTRRRRDLSTSAHSAAIASRQVHNPRDALERWEKRDEIELARRATPSNSVAVCLGSVGAWGQCGGQGWTSDTCCVAGYTCVYSNDYYSQCLPSPSSASSSSTKASATSTSSAPAATSTASAYSQCSGIGFTPMLCPSSFSCQYVNDYYSQCLPQAATTQATSSTSTKASSTSTAPMSTATALGQCGGLGAPTKLCPAGYVCDTTNSLFNQCLPVGSSSSSTKASTSSTTASAPLQTVLPYAQCGGGSASLALCPAGWRCDATNPSFWQCVPQAVYTSSTAVASSASSASASAPPASSSTKATSTSAPVVSSQVTSSSSVASAPTTIQTAAPFGTCGGQGVPVALCPATYFCAVINTYYAQCLPVTASTLSLATAPTTTATSFSTVTRSSSSSLSASSSSSAPSASASVNTCPVSNAWAQCDGFLWLSKVCCPTNYYCSYQSMFYSQCVPGTGPTTSAATSSTSASSTSKAASSTSSSAAPSATSSQICNPNSGGSDGCTPYAVSWSGVTLPSPKVFQDNGHVNYQAIPKSQYKPGQTYLTSGNGWTPQSFGVHFESLNNQPSGVYIGRNFYDWSLAAKAFPSGYCITWVQIDIYNQHFGEGGQAPICTP